MTARLPEKYPFPLGDELATVEVPLGQPHVSQLSGRVFMSSDLGFVDIPPDYEPRLPEGGAPDDDRR